MRRIYRLTLEQIEEIIIEHFDDFVHQDKVKVNTQMLMSECECGDKKYGFIVDVKKIEE